MDDFLEVFFDKCDENCIEMLVNSTLAASCGTIRRKICYDDGFMQRMTQAQFYLTVSLLPITLITKAIEILKEQKKREAFDDFRAKGTLTVQLHRLTGSGKARSLAWSPVIHTSIDSLLTQTANIESMMKSLQKPRLHMVDVGDAERKPVMHIGDLCVVQLERQVLADLCDAITATLNEESAVMMPSSFSAETVVMAVTEEPFSRTLGNIATCKMRVLLITESDLRTIHKARTIGQGKGHSGGKWNPSGIAHSHGSYSSFRLLRWRQLEKMADLWFDHTARLEEHYDQVPHALCTYDGITNDASGSPLKKGRNQNLIGARGKTYREKTGEVWYWNPWEHEGINDPQLTCFTLLRPTARAAR